MTATENLRIAVHQHVSANTSPEQRLQGLERTLKGAGHSPVDLVVCPELFLSGYRAGDRIPSLAETAGGPFAQRVADIARRNGCAIVYGYPEAAEGNVYNAAMAVAKDGSRLVNHRKTILPNAYEKMWFGRGRRLSFLELAGWKVAVLVCYEIEFPEIVRACAVKGADLVVVPTALAREWDVVARKVVPSRAFENGVYIAYANYGGCEEDLAYLGESCIVGPDGRDLARAASGDEMIAATLDRSTLRDARSRLAYLKDSEALAGLHETDFVASGDGTSEDET